MSEIITNKKLKHEKYPMLALRGMVVYPNMIVHFDVGRKKSINAINKAMATDKYVFLITQRDFAINEPKKKDIYNLGVVAKIRQTLKLHGDGMRVLVEGLYRAEVTDVLDNPKYLVAEIEPTPEVFTVSEDVLSKALVRRCRTYFEEYSTLSVKIPPDVMIGVARENDVGALADFIAANIRLPFEVKQEILEIIDPVERIEQVMITLKNEIQVISVEHEINERVQEQIDRNQRDYVLREQMKAISEELGGGDSPQEEAGEYEKRILELGLEKEAEEKLLEEARKLFRMPSGSHEATVVRGYLETCLSLPWNEKTEDRLELATAQEVLDEDHYGMDKVKERILEILAVRNLIPDLKGQVVCLAGPPGVGKTSIARSIASAMNRNYARVSLGGVRDEAEIRGHRKTYIGSMPGRIINGIKQAGSINPVILLDEIDKMGNDFRGDPSSAMLEVLDVEQNFAFRDHYLEIPFDLSQVLFITTANNTGAIPRPLYDRMEIIDLPSYTTEEKYHIAKRHLIKKQVSRHGMTLSRLRFPDETIYEIIEGYTREAGVRECERVITSLCRKAAKHLIEKNMKSMTVTKKVLESFLGPRKYKKDDMVEDNQVGVVNGLAWTSIGGTIMAVEAVVLEGKGKIQLTGSLGDVMKESAQAAVSFIRSRAEVWNIDPKFYKDKDIHIHVPEGAVPKDGPSAGVTIATAIISALTGIPVQSRVAMTGEITLRGKVLPIGGLREKAMAAYRQGIQKVIIPKDNETDLYEVDKVVKEKIDFAVAESLDDVIEQALEEVYMKNTIFSNDFIKDGFEKDIKNIDLTQQEFSEDRTGISL